MQKFIEQFKALPQWQRYLILLALPLILIVYIWLMLVSPAVDEVSKLKVDIQNVKADIQRIKSSLNPAFLENLRKEEESLKQEYMEKQAELVKLVGEIPTEKEMDKSIVKIWRIARKFNVAVLNMQVSDPQKTAYSIYQEGDRKVVKEYQEQAQQPQQDQQQQQQQQQTQQPQESISLLKSEVRLSLLGDYNSLRAFLDSLRREGMISYPVSLSISSEGRNLKADLVIYILMKEG